MRIPLLILALLLSIVPTFAGPPTLAYVLQAENLAKTRAESIDLLTKSDRDLLILDPFFKANDRYTPKEIEKIRAGKFGRKILAYLSVGEAENYRPYWQKDWKPGHPEFLLAENPDWKGNFRVKYWHPAWQMTIIAQLDPLLAQRFDGVYLDILDGFETFEFNPATKDYEDNKLNPETNKTFRQDMIDFVQLIAGRLRAKNQSALLFSQNASQLLADDEFAKTISGVGIEDLFNNGKKSKKPAEVKLILDRLLTFQTQYKKPIALIDYAHPDKPELADQARLEAFKSNFSFLHTDRELKTLGKSP